MTNETRSPAEIERDIESHRSDLTSNLEGLQDKFSIDTLVRQIGDQFREHGGDMGRSISNQVKTNPVPLALTGIGLAWMMFGNSQKPSPAREYYSPEDEYRRTRLARNRPYTPPVSRASDYDAAYDTSPSWARDDTEVRRGYAGSVSERAAHARDQAAKGADKIKGDVTSAASSVADTASSAAASVSDTASSAKSAVASGAESLKSGLSDARSRIAEGTENLTEEGRQRVIAARQKAIEMKRSTKRSVNDGADVAADFYDRQPLVVGALALAFGAALGGALPKTRAEDDLVGEHSDALYDEAERVFEEEKAKAMKVADSVKDEVKDIADETKSELDNSAPGQKSAAQAVGDKAKSAADRVADTAKTTAKDEKLGKPKT